MPIKAALSIFFFLFSVTNAFSQFTLDSVPNQKLINGSYVSDPGGILQQSTIQQADTLLTSLEKQTTVQVAVVLLESIGEKDIVDFAQELFNKWGIGDQTKNNGLLLLLVKDQRTVRFHTGYGLEGVLPDITCKTIQMDYMVPAFKEGRYDDGIMAGLEEVVKIITDPVYAQEFEQKALSEETSYSGVSESNGITLQGVWFAFVFLLVPLLGVFVYRYNKKQFTNQQKPSQHKDPIQTSGIQWLSKYILTPFVILVAGSMIHLNTHLLLVVLYIYYACMAINRIMRMHKKISLFANEEEYGEIVTFMNGQTKYIIFFSVLFPLPVLFYLFYFYSRKKFYRNHPRTCDSCKNKMYKLDEMKDDTHLSDKEKLEEEIQSVDYDIFKCSGCDAVKKYFYPNKWSRYTVCKKCNTKTFYLLSDTVVIEPTYSSSGSGERKYLCRYCKHTKNDTYSIAKLVESSSSGSSSFGSSSGSSSSSGGSWGGGSSGGGGASSSW